MLTVIKRNYKTAIAVIAHIATIIGLFKTTANKKQLIKYFMCTEHNDKMKGMYSLSTSSRFNLRCIARAKNPDSICFHCFSNALQKQYDALEHKLHLSLIFFTNVDLKVKDIPVINYNDIFRLEAFGDLQNTLQVKNYFTICNVNKHITFALWTKNPDIIADALQEYAIEKPENLIIIYSSDKTNVVSPVEYDFIDKVFTVYDPEYAEAHNVDINCGARCCNTCRRCYKFTEAIEYINELKK